MRPSIDSNTLEALKLRNFSADRLGDYEKHFFANLNGTDAIRNHRLADRGVIINSPELVKKTQNKLDLFNSLAADYQNTDLIPHYLGLNEFITDTGQGSKVDIHSFLDYAEELENPVVRTDGKSYTARGHEIVPTLLKKGMSGAVILDEKDFIHPAYVTATKYPVKATVRNKLMPAHILEASTQTGNEDVERMARNLAIEIAAAENAGYITLCLKYNDEGEMIIEDVTTRLMDIEGFKGLLRALNETNFKV